jgi:N-acetylmuramate 1-kinase
MALTDLQFSFLYFRICFRLHVVEFIKLNNNLPIYEFIRAFLHSQGLLPNNFKLTPLAGDGSIRLFSRLSLQGEHETFMVMENSPSTEFLKRENFAYLMIGRHLFDKGLPLPEMYSCDLNNGWFIMEDMGDVKLQDEVMRRKDSLPRLEEAVGLLFRMQTQGMDGFKKEWCCQTESYDWFVMRNYESDYFRNSFLINYLGIKNQWPELEEPFEHLAQKASMAECKYYLHRDFQSRNIMIRRNGLSVLDWQGGRIGPLGYDLASLLLDPYINIDANEKKHLYVQYVSLLNEYNPDGVWLFEKSFPYLAIQRNLQILGAFAKLTKALGKTYFKEYIPPALKSLDLLLDETADPKLSLLRQLVHDIALNFK